MKLNKINRNLAPCLQPLTSFSFSWNQMVCVGSPPSFIDLFILKQASPLCLTCGESKQPAFKGQQPLENWERKKTRMLRCCRHCQEDAANKVCLRVRSTFTFIIIFWKYHSFHAGPRNTWLTWEQVRRFTNTPSDFTFKVTGRLEAYCCCFKTSPWTLARCGLAKSFTQTRLYKK